MIHQRILCAFVLLCSFISYYLITDWRGLDVAGTLQEGGGSANGTEILSSAALLSLNP